MSATAHRPSAVLWLPLAVVTLVVLVMHVARVCIVTVYNAFPNVLDRLYTRSRIVRRLFAYRLRGGQEAVTSPPMQPHVRAPGEQQHHAAHPHNGHGLVHGTGAIGTTRHRTHGKPAVDPDCFLDAPGLVRRAGYPLETHHVQTSDGFLLVLHRIPHAPGQHASAGAPRPAVLLMHGLMLTSEAWLLNKTASLPYQLANAGFDVWLGNNRGNKYSCKHRHLSPDDDQYWNFSLDELAAIDLPTMINYVCDRAQQDKIAYIGFSNGSAQAFAAFSMDDELAERVSCFVALSPAIKVTGLSNSLASAVINSNTRYLYLVFGTKMMLSIAVFWQQVLSTQVLVQVIDFCLWYLFGWRCMHWPAADKPRIYYHIFSWTSVKHIVHWFQIITTGRFAMYDDTQREGWFQTPEYDVGRVRVPLALFYGGRDTMIDADALLSSVSRPFLTHLEPTYEHLDFLWADTAPTVVFPKICALLKHRDQPEPEHEYEQPGAAKAL